MAEFQAALQHHLPGLADSEAAEAELRMTLTHPAIETVRRADLRAEITKIRKKLEEIAALRESGIVTEALFRRRRENEHLKTIAECVFMLQVWEGAGLSTVLDLFENEAAAEIDSYTDQGSTKWSGVWAIDALTALWSRQKQQAWNSNSVKWEGARSRGVYLRSGHEFLSAAFQIDGTVESAFERWVELRKRPKVV